MKQYKVLSQKDTLFRGKFDPASLESALNALAREGWRVVTCATADYRSLLGGTRQEVAVILERDA
jgi:hypothetical protein